MKKIKFFLLSTCLLIGHFAFGQTSPVTPTFRSNTTQSVHNDPLIYSYAGKTGGPDSIYTKYFIDRHFVNLSSNQVKNGRLQLNNQLILGSSLKYLNSPNIGLGYHFVLLPDSTVGMDTVRYSSLLHVDSLIAALGGSTIYTGDGTILTDRFVNTTSHRELFFGDNDNATAYVDILPNPSGGVVQFRGSDSASTSEGKIKLTPTFVQISSIDNTNSNNGNIDVNNNSVAISTVNGTSGDHMDLIMSADSNRTYFEDTRSRGINYSFNDDANMLPQGLMPRRYIDSSITSHAGISDTTALARKTGNAAMQQNSYKANGTAGNGYIALSNQSVSPTKVSGTLKMYRDSVGSLGYINGLYRRTFKIKRMADQTINFPYRSNPTIADSTDVSTKYKTKLTPNISVNYPSWMLFRPFQILQKNDLYYANANQYDIISQKIANMQPYYTDYINGNNANNGLTPSTPVKTISYAYTTLGARLIYDLTVGVELNDTWGSLNASFTNTDDFFVIGMGKNKTYITSAPATTPTWTLGTSATYSATVTACKNAVDMAFTDSLGFPLRLKVATSLANCQTTAGSFFISGTTINVHLTDGRAPDAKVLALANVANATYSANAGYHYVSGITFMGGGTITGAHGTIAQTGVNNTAVNMSFDCNFLYAESTSYNSNGGEGTRSTYTFLSWHKNDIAYGNARDGFNYEGEVSYRSHVIEENCQSYSNGLKLTSTSVNGSSAHNSMDVIRINDKAHYNSGPNYADVDGVLTLNVGCEAWACLSFAATGGANQSDYIIDNITSGLDTKMQNIGCKSADSLVSYRILNPAVNAIMNIDSTSTYRAAFSGAVTVGNLSTSTVVAFSPPLLSSYTANATYQPFIVAGTTTQYWRGDKTWQPINWVTLAGTNTISATNTITGPNTVTAAGSFTFASGTIISNPPTAAGTYALIVRDATSNQFQKVQTLPVGNGGTGATSITGLVKGNGTAAFTAAVGNTDYLPVANPVATGLFKVTTVSYLPLYQGGTATVTPTADSLDMADGQKLVRKAIVAGTGVTITQTASTITFANSSSRSAVNVTANATMALNTDYQNISTTQYVLTLPPCTSFAVNGSQLITVDATNTGGIKISVPNGYALNGSGGATLTDGTGYITISAHQKVQLVPSTTTANTYEYNAFNGTVGVH